MIDHEQKLLHIHIPKTGGTSMRKVLIPGVEETKHETAREFPVDVWEEYFTFAVVRNPYDRSVSQYMYHCKGRYRGVLARKDPNLSSLSFVEYLKKYVEQQKNTMFFPQLDYVTHDKTSTPIDFLGRFESLRESFTQLKERLARPDLELPHLLKSKHSHYLEYHDATTRRIVEKIYAKDLNAFGYSFD